ncbi:MarR family transcriptional regulator [Dactylosporangium sp. NPDC005572]|uniref:MarR family winged helix-turn-helix transcriptional regulator n=1 Tax=Dactylosporangium sp. NPDC005572 TaxID=3156889 RepID=UPI00339EE9DC
MSENERPPTLLGLPSYLAAHVAQIARRPLVDELAARDLRLPHFAVLAGLHDFGATAQHELAGRLGFNRSHLVGYLDHLEQAGHVTRERDSDDRRRHHVQLTPSGARLAVELIETAQAVERERLDILSAKELRTLAMLLRRVLDANDAGERAD